MELFGVEDASAKIEAAFSGLSDMATNFLKTILKSVLPNPKSGIFGKIVSAAIPDEVYKFAGLDPKTGKEVPQANVQPQTGVTPQGAAVGTGSQDVAVAREQSAAPVVIGGSTNNNVTNQNVTNRTTYQAPAPPPRASQPAWGTMGGYDPSYGVP